MTAALFAAAFAFGCVGVDWDLPSGSRAQRVLAPAWDKRELFDKLAGGWEEIYRNAAGSTPLAAETEGKYSTHLAAFSTDFSTPLPPRELWNSYRSMLIRSRYPDEALPLSDLARMKPAKLDFRPPSFLYGGGYLYPLGAYYLALSKLGIVEPLPLRSALERTATLGGVYLAGRLLSAAAFAGICLLAFLIARRLEPGASAAAFAAVLTLPVLGVHARYLTPHLWSAFFAMTSIYFALKALPELELRPLLASGAFLGLAAGSYWSAAHAALFLLAIVLSPGRAAFRPEALKRIGLAVIAALAVFIALNPYVLPNWAEALRELRYGGAPVDALRETRSRLLFSSIFPATLGPVFALLFPAGCVWGVFSGRPLLRNLSLAALLFALPASTTLFPDFPQGVRRYFPWVIIGTLMGVVFLSRLTSRLGRPARTAVFALAVAPGLLMSSVYALAFADASGPRSTYRRLADTLDSMPAGATLGLVDMPQPANLPAFRLDRWKLRLAELPVMLSLPKKDLPEYLLVNYFRKAALAPLLAEDYGLYASFRPRGLPGFSPDPLICAANPPVELYKLKKADNK